LLVGFWLTACLFVSWFWINWPNPWYPSWRLHWRRALRLLELRLRAFGGVLSKS
jgi:hypothetical protein